MVGDRSRTDAYSRFMRSMVQRQFTAVGRVPASAPRMAFATSPYVG
jgi:hypothetical protein